MYLTNREEKSTKGAYEVSKDANYIEGYKPRRMAVTTAGMTVRIMAVGAKMLEYTPSRSVPQIVCMARRGIAAVKIGRVWDSINGKHNINSFNPSPKRCLGRDDCSGDVFT